MEGTCTGIINIVRSSVTRGICGQPYSKTKRAFKNTGPLCPDCTSRATNIKKLTNKISANNALLLKHAQNDTL